MVIQFVTFLSPNVEGHDSPLKGSRKLTIPKRAQRIARIWGFPCFFLVELWDPTYNCLVRAHLVCVEFWVGQ